MFCSSTSCITSGISLNKSRRRQLVNEQSDYQRMSPSVQRSLQEIRQKQLEIVNIENEKLQAQLQLLQQGEGSSAFGVSAKNKYDYEDMQRSSIGAMQRSTTGENPESTLAQTLNSELQKQKLENELLKRFQPTQQQFEKLKEYERQVAEKIEAHEKEILELQWLKPDDPEYKKILEEYLEFQSKHLTRITAELQKQRDMARQYFLENQKLRVQMENQEKQITSLQTRVEKSRTEAQNAKVIIQQELQDQFSRKHQNMYNELSQSLKEAKQNQDDNAQLKRKIETQADEIEQLRAQCEIYRIKTDTLTRQLSNQKRSTDYLNDKYTNLSKNVQGLFTIQAEKQTATNLARMKELSLGLQKQLDDNCQTINELEMLILRILPDKRNANDNPVPKMHQIISQLQFIIREQDNKILSILQQSGQIQAKERYQQRVRDVIREGKRKLNLEYRKGDLGPGVVGEIQLSYQQLQSRVKQLEMQRYLQQGDIDSLDEILESMKEAYVMLWNKYCSQQ